MTSNGPSRTPDRDTIKPEITKRSVMFRVAAFLLILAVLFACLNDIFQPAFTRENNYLAEGYFYDEPNNTIETVILGASISYQGITPMELYENYGICAYALGTSNQPVLASYYRLEEAYRLHKETLKTVVFEISILGGRKAESWYRVNTDGMRLSPIKWRAISDYTDSFEDTLNYMIPLLSYHDRWTELSETDFINSGYDDRSYLRGYYTHMLRQNRYFLDNSYDSLSVPDYYPDYTVEGGLLPPAHQEGHTAAHRPLR